MNNCHYTTVAGLIILDCANLLLSFQDSYLVFVRQSANWAAHAFARAAPSNAG